MSARNLDPSAAPAAARFTPGDCPTTRNCQHFSAHIAGRRTDGNHHCRWVLTRLNLATVPREVSMRRTTLYLLLSLVVAAQAQAVKKVTVEQLIGQIGSFSRQSDARAAKKLYDLQLTERLSTNKLATFEAALPGP